MSARETRARWLLTASAIGAWAAVTELGLVRHRALASPTQVVLAAGTAITSGELVSDVAATLARVLASVAIGALAGLTLGLALGRKSDFARAGESCLDFLRAVPPLLLLPFFLLAFGYGDAARVGVSALAATLVMSLHVAAGLRAVDPSRERTLRAMGATWWQRVRWVHVYELAPHVLTGARQATTTAIVVCVVTELVVGADHGLGARALAAQLAYDAPGLYVAILATGTLGLAISRAPLWAERRWLTWLPSQERDRPRERVATH